MSDIDNLMQAVVDRDSYKVQCFIVDRQNELVDNWMHSRREEFLRYLSLAMQKSVRAKKKLIHEEDEIPYQLGVWEGWVQAFYTLQNEELKEHDIICMAVKKNPQTYQIIRCLYQNDRTMKHGRLAKTLGISYKDLIDDMKRVISSGAVSVSGTGRNTHYTLTPVACKYCRERMERDAQTVARDEIEALADSLEDIAKLLKTGANGTEQRSINLSDIIHISHKGDEHLSDAKQVSAIVEFAGRKILQVDDVVSNVSIPISETRSLDKISSFFTGRSLKNSYQKPFPHSLDDRHYRTKQPLPKSYTAPALLRKQSLSPHPQFPKEK